MRRLTSSVLRHRRIVAATWFLLLVAGLIGAGRVSDRLSIDFSLPGQPGSTTASEITRLYGNGGSQPPAILTATLPAGRTVTADEARLAAAFDAVRHQVPGLRIVDFAATRDARFITSDGRSTYALPFAPQPHSFNASPLIDQAKGVAAASLGSSAQVGLTGLDQLASGGNQQGTSVLFETLIGAAGALVILAFVFGSFLALVPLLIAAVSILTTLLVVLGMTYVTD